MTVSIFDAHKPIAHLPTAGRSDVVQCRPRIERVLRRLFTRAISVFQEGRRRSLRKLEIFPVKRKCIAWRVDVKTHRVYTPEEQEDAIPVSRMIVLRSSGEGAADFTTSKKIQEI